MEAIESDLGEQLDVLGRFWLGRKPKGLDDMIGTQAKVQWIEERVVNLFARAIVKALGGGDG
jgi:hypothetical protein